MEQKKKNKGRKSTENEKQWKLLGKRRKKNR